MDRLIPDAELRHCRTCGAKIFWARMPSGAQTPFDFEPSPVGGYVIGAWDVKMPNGARGFIQMTKFDPLEDRDERRYASHFTTCAQASDHSRKGRRA